MWLIEYLSLNILVNIDAYWAKYCMATDFLQIAWKYELSSLCCKNYVCFNTDIIILWVIEFNILQA